MKLLDNMVAKVILLFLGVLLFKMYYDPYLSTFSESLGSALGSTLGIIFWAYIGFLLMNLTNKNDTNRPKFKDKFVLYTCVLSLIGAGIAINDSIKNQEMIKKVEVLNDESKDDIQFQEEALITGDFEKERPLLQNPQNDEEVFINITREHRNKITALDSYYYNQISNLKLFSLFENLESMKETIIKTSDNDFLEEIEKGKTHERDFILKFKNEKENLLKLLKLTDWKDEDFGNGLLIGTPKGNAKAIKLTEAMYAINTQILEKTYELVKAHNDCIDDWSVEEVDGVLAINYESTNEEDFSKLAQIRSEIQRLSNEQISMWRDSRQEVSESLDNLIK
tara:strand:- start:1063 stop:2073 length:1011 start_codon:yes stop_codon:yes gene_type:complete